MGQCGVRSRRCLHAIGLTGAMLVAVGNVGALAQDEASLRALELTLQRTYENRILTLRGFPTGRRVRYDTRGERLGSSHTGIWTLDGRVRVEQVRLSRDSLRLGCPPGGGVVRRRGADVLQRRHG